MSPSRYGGVRLAVLVLFFLSGACGLIYEVVWMRMLTLVFGATAFATGAILASFFSGLALGSLYFGRVADRTRNPIALYGLLEAGLGVAAFLTPLVFSGLSTLYAEIARHLSVGYYPLVLVRLVLAFLVLLIPTTLMGGTLPVIVRFMVRRPESLGRHVGTLYAVNTFGAVLGAFTAGFFLILLLGLREALYLAGTLNLLIAVAALVLSRHQSTTSARASEPTVGARQQEGGPGPTAPTRLTRIALWAVGISGLCALALEVLWTRALVFFLDNSTHAFTTMLTAFLLGIAIGSALVTRVVDRIKRLLACLGVIEILIGLSALTAIPILAAATPALQRMLGATPDPLLHWKWAGTRFLTSLSVMLLPSVLMGTTVPLVVRFYARGLDRVGTSMGRVYSINTLGGVVGSVLAGFVLVPFVGVREGIVLMASVSVVLGLVLVVFEPVAARKKGMIALAAAGLTLAGAGAVHVARSATTLSSFRETLDAVEVLSYHEGIGSTVKVFSDQNGERILSIDGFPVAGTSMGLRDAQMVLGNLPMLLSEAPSARVNLIGFGAGAASWTVLQYGAGEVDCVELVPAVIDAAPWFEEVNHGVLTDPRFNLILGDGRNHALVTERTYDVVSIDATSPKMAGNGSLYTVEFYELLKEQLSAEGVVVQWLPFHLLSGREMRMTARTFRTVFPHTTVWLSPIRTHGVLVGTQTRLQIDLASLERKLSTESVRHALEALNVSNPLDVLSWFVMGEEELENYVGTATLNTDNHPYLEFTPAMAYFHSTRYAASNLRDLAMHRESVAPWLVPSGESEAEVARMAARLERRFRATQRSIQGDIFFYLGMTQRAVREYRAALRIDPTDRNWAHPVWRDARQMR